MMSNVWILILYCLIPAVVQSSEVLRSNFLPGHLPEESDCPSDGDKIYVNQQRPWGEPNRAYNTLPDGLEIRNSTIPNAGQGVFTWVFIPKYTWLGEYEGEVVDSSSISAYAWGSMRDGEADYYIDGGHIETSSWQRFVNCPRNKREENVIIYECRGKVHYQASRDLYPGEELFVYYGDKYAEYLGINARNYNLNFN